MAVEVKNPLQVCNINAFSLRGGGRLGLRAAAATVPPEVSFTLMGPL